MAKCCLGQGFADFTLTVKLVDETRHFGLVILYAESEDAERLTASKH